MCREELELVTVSVQRVCVCLGFRSGDVGVSVVPAVCTFGLVCGLFLGDRVGMSDGLEINTGLAPALTFLDAFGYSS